MAVKKQYASPDAYEAKLARVMEQIVSRDQARTYFKQCDLSYKDINLRALRYLRVEVDEEFNKQRKDAMNGNAYEYWHRVNDAKYFKGKYAGDGHVICAFLTAKGAYFNAREVISFNQDGFIGFAGAADDTNVRPVLIAFMRWCEWLKEDKRLRIEVRS